jgi:hypothetical protein
MLDGALTLIDSTVRGNRARQDGGIANMAASVILIDSTGRADTSVKAGGGIHNVGETAARPFQRPGQHAMLTVTVSGSTAVAANDPNDCVGTPAC